MEGLLIQKCGRRGRLQSWLPWGACVRQTDGDWCYLAWYTDKCSKEHATSTVTTDTTHGVTSSSSSYVLIHRRPHQQVRHIGLPTSSCSSSSVLPLTGTALQSLLQHITTSGLEKNHDFFKFKKIRFLDLNWIFFYLNQIS